MGQNVISNDEWWVVVCCCGDQSNREAEQEIREDDIKQIDIEIINGSVFTSAKQKKRIDSKEKNTPVVAGTKHRNIDLLARGA